MKKVIVNGKEVPPAKKLKLDTKMSPVAIRKLVEEKQKELRKNEQS